MAQRGTPALLALAVWASGVTGCTLDLSDKHQCNLDGRCNDGRECVDGMCRDMGKGDKPNFMFVTSAMMAPHFASLDEADAVCATAATSAHLEGNFHAWLSTSTEFARERLNGAGGWVRTDGKPFANQIEDIAIGRILNPPNLDENKKPVTGPVMTGTGPDGNVVAGSNCADWTSQASDSFATIGSIEGTTGVWTLFSKTHRCDMPAHLYCFGVDRSAVVMGSATGKLAFLSDDPFPIGGGAEAADAQCQRESLGIGRGGTFHALLATTAAVASARVAGNAGARWVRLDGVPLFDGEETSFPSALLAPLNLTSRRRYVDATVFTGAMDPNTPASEASACGDWTDTGRAASVGRASFLPWWFNSDRTLACDTSEASIYCFQVD